MTFEQMKTALENFVVGLSFRSTKTSADSEDHQQEAWCKVWEISKRDLPDDKKLALARVSVANLFRDLARARKARPGPLSGKSTEDTDPTTLVVDPVDTMSRIATGIAIDKATKMLNHRDLAVLREFLEPSDKTFNLAVQDSDRSQEMEARGKLTMNVGKVRLRGKHVAESLGMGKATVSRSLSVIRQTLLNAGFQPA